MTREQIKDFCTGNRIYAYSIKYDDQGMYLDVMQDVVLTHTFMSCLQIRFGLAGHDFSCALLGMTSLVGFPTDVGGDFNCGHNKLTSLLGCPKSVGTSFFGGDFKCHNNDLTSLEHCPVEVGGDFICYGNKLVDESYYHLFELGFDIDKIYTDDWVDLVALKRKWFINKLINE